MKVEVDGKTIDINDNVGKIMLTYHITDDAVAIYMQLNLFGDLGHISTVIIPHAQFEELVNAYMRLSLERAKKGITT